LEVKHIKGHELWEGVKLPPHNFFILSQQLYGDVKVHRIIEVDT